MSGVAQPTFNLAEGTAFWMTWSEIEIAHPYCRRDTWWAPIADLPDDLPIARSDIRPGSAHYLIGSWSDPKLDPRTEGGPGGAPHQPDQWVAVVTDGGTHGNVQICVAAQSSDAADSLLEQYRLLFPKDSV